MTRLSLIILTRLIISLSIPLSTSAQTEDTTRSIAQTQSADTSKSSPSSYKKQISEIVKSLVEQKQFLPLSFSKSRTKYRIRQDAPLFKLPFGESRVALFELPDYVWEYILKIRSLVHGIGYTFHIFSPSGVFLDSSFRPTRLLSEKNFLLSNPGSYKILALETEVPINEYRKRDKYLLIYTLPDSARLGTYSDSKGGLIVSMLKHPVKRSPDGKLILEVHRR